MSFNLEDYETVDERIEKFFAKYPEASLQSELAWVQNGWLCKAYAYRSADDERPGVGYAFEQVPGKTPYTKDSEAMNAETHARGRAIVALGLTAKKNASREEVAARQGSAGESNQPGRSGAGNSPAETLIPFGKHKGQRIDSAPSHYWEWWLGSDHAAKPEMRDFRALVELHMGLTGAAVAADDTDDIPF